MKFRFSNLKPSLVMFGALTALAVTGCGDDGSTDIPAGGDAGEQSTDTSGDPTGEDSTTDDRTSESTDPTDDTNGATSEPNGSSGMGTEPVPSTDVDGSVPPTGDGGTDEPPPASGNVDDLIGAICEWEFRCCDDGERAYRFGPSIADAATCRERFVQELRESNSTKNPFVAGQAAGGLLASLAYAINLSRVEINEEAVAACTEQWNDLGCNEPAPDEIERCTAGNTDVVNPCSLNELFKPVLEQDDTCTPSLGQGASNDIECVEGTSCLAADDPANGNGVPSCIKRGLLEDFCQDDSDCDFGLYCDGSSCAEKGDEGDDCTYDDDEGSGVHPHSCKPGLSCDPESLACVAACTAGFECQSDYQCPDGLSCAPIYADDELFHVCRELGDSITHQCDDQNDCVEDQYCNRADPADAIGNCAGDKDVDEDCTGVTGQCTDGTFCDAVEGTCKAYNTPDEECSRADNTAGDPKDFPECSPETAGCFPRYDEESATIQYFCRNAKNADGVECWVAADCHSNKCELDPSEESPTGYACTSGADVGEDCDAYMSCKAGAACDPAGKCVEQMLPGEDCENPDTEMADSYLCANGMCSEQWDSLICSDAPVPESAGGSGVTCDGNP